MSQAFNQNNNDQLNSLAFLDDSGSVGIPRYESIKYKSIDKLTEKQLGFFWVPQEIDLSKDQNDYKQLTSFEKHIFSSNLKRQILLDGVQGRCPALALLPLVSLPEIEAFILHWSAQEALHSRSYTHIIRNIYSNPSHIFDTMLDIAEIIDCAKDISEYYDRLIYLSNLYNSLGLGKHVINGEEVKISKYEIKKALWLTLMSVNVLEGLRFYVSFACSWSFAESKKMEGNAKIIKLICRDENVHLAFTQLMLKVLPKDDPDYEKIRLETLDDCKKIFIDAANQEKEWAKYLFKDGSIIGLNEQLLNDYIDWLTHKRMSSIGLKYDGNVPTANPLPWTNKWIAGEDVQNLPQEVNITSYTIGEVNNDLKEDTFKGFKL